MAYSKLVQAFADAWGSVSGFFAQNQFENVDWSTFQKFSKANADLHDRGPNAQRGLLKRFRYVTQAEVADNGNEGDALENLDYDTCCVGTHIIVQYYQPDPLVAATRDQLLVAAYDPSPDAKFVYSDGSFRAGDRIAPAKFVPATSPAGQYGYVRRDTVPPSIQNWREGELSIWELNSIDQFATAKQAGGPWPAFTGAEDAYWKPAAPPASSSGASGATFLMGTYTVKPSDVTSPASDIVVPTPGAVAITSASVLRPGNSEGDKIYPVLPGAAGGDYTIQPGQFTILAKLNPSLPVGAVVQWSYLTGNVQAAGVTPSQLEAVRTTAGLSTAVSTNYTLALSDAGNIVPVTAAVNITVPLHSTVSFPVGAVLELVATTPALFTVQVASGVTVLAATGNLAAGQGIPIRLVQMGVDFWLLTGGSA